MIKELKCLAAYDIVVYVDLFIVHRTQEGELSLVCAILLSTLIFKMSIVFYELK